MQIYLLLIKIIKDENIWKKVVNNISLKDNDYPGSKDISRMRLAI